MAEGIPGAPWRGREADAPGKGKQLLAGELLELRHGLREGEVVAVPEAAVRLEQLAAVGGVDANLPGGHPDAMLNRQPAGHRMDVDVVGADGGRWRVAEMVDD